VLPGRVRIAFIGGRLSLLILFVIFHRKNVLFYL
jgi:hypothetical protein